MIHAAWRLCGRNTLGFQWASSHARMATTTSWSTVVLPSRVSPLLRFQIRLALPLTRPTVNRRVKPLPSMVWKPSRRSWKSRKKTPSKLPRWLGKSLPNVHRATRNWRWSRSSSFATTLNPLVQAMVRLLLLLRAVAHRYFLIRQGVQSK